MTNSIDTVVGQDDAINQDATICLEEELITLTEATKHLPKVDGKKVSVCTLWRWSRRGLRGVYQEFRVGWKRRYEELSRRGITGKLSAA